MMYSKFFRFLNFCLLAGILIGFAACGDKNKSNGEEPANAEGRAYFNVVFCVDEEGGSGNAATYAQAFADLSKTTDEISFTNNRGFVVPATRTARVYASKDGKYVYNLDYGGGTVHKYEAKGGSSYVELKKTGVQHAVGTPYPRWTKVNEDYASLHHITTENKYDAEQNYTYTAATAYFVSIELENMYMGAVERFEIPRSSEDEQKKTYVWRTDAPVVHNGKAFYGIAKQTYNPSTGRTDNTVEYSASSIVVDYPSLTNPAIITSSVAKGSTYGYRTPVAHVDESGDIYQIAGSPAYILKIRNGQYDNNFRFNLAEKLNITGGVGSNGWFYVGNGVGYVPFYDLARGSGSAAAAWGVARVDLKNGTAVKMNLPGNLWLQQYQYSVTDDNGKFYMALTPFEGDGHIYIFDPTSASPDAFVKGAALKTGNGAYYIGIF